MEVISPNKSTTLTDYIKANWKSIYQKLNDDIFGFTMVKPVPADWVERIIKLPDSTSVYPGHFSYDWTPYMRKIINHVHPGDPVRFITVMKCVQSGATAGLVIPALCYIIDQIPDPILFTGGDLMLAAKTIEERLDPILRSSQLDHNIRPNVIKKTNNRSGDTSKKKEFAGGTLTALGTNSANSFRFFSARYIFADDYDTAPRDLGDEGSVKSLMQGRQNSYGDKAKSFFISTPTVTQTSNIYEQYMLGTQNKWHWPCPACETFFPLDWKITCDDGTIAGMVWELDDKKQLKPESVFLKCPHCGHLISENEKYELNLKGDWISTIETPVERRHESYLIPGIALPPGFTGWVTLVEEWLQANPPGEKPVIRLLKAFNNLRLGLPFEELGEAPKVNKLMENTGSYHPGIIPDLTVEKDGNGKIILLTLACDINGIMTPDNEDIRLDWEILAHTSYGQTYSIDHGSIGTFKRVRDVKKHEADTHANRMKWTLVDGSMAINEAGERVTNCVWSVFEEIIQKVYIGESGKDWSIDITLVDTGYGEKLASQFIDKMQQKGLYVYGVKGRTDENGRKLQRDSNPVKRSTEKPRTLYILEVDQLKDDLSQMMKLREGDDGTQPSGFMNFPESRDGKYDMKNYFIHYEGERRNEILSKSGDIAGFKWVKKNSQSQNHFWDVRIYNLAAPLVFVDLLRQSDPRYKNITWEEAIQILIKLK